VYAETYVPKLYMNGAALRALREDRFKLIDAPRPELYDLAHDPGETRNRFEDEPAIAGRLRAELARLTAGADETSRVGRVDDEAVEKLRALGYLGAGSEVARSTRDEKEKDPKDLIVVFNRLRQAEREVRQRKFSEALPILHAVVAEEPRNAFAHMLLGSAHMGMRQYALAVQPLRTYLALVPSSSQAHQWMAVCYTNLGDRKSALREAGSALALDPHLVDAHLLRAGILSALGRRAEAVQELRAAVTTDPEKPPLRMSLAEVLSDAGLPAESEAEYRAILRQEPAFAPALAGLGAVLLRRGALQEASDAFRRALEVDPRQDEARFNLAQVLERQGRPQEARAEYERLARDSDTPAPVRDAARVRLRASSR
jgi:tetratricopeptide (TPR) repeat protein